MKILYFIFLPLLPYNSVARLFTADIKPFTVVISEIMADPIPAVMLPSCEYIEIYNSNPFRVNLAGWKIISGSRQAEFQDMFIEACSYSLICDAYDAAEFAGFGDVLPVKGMPAVINGEGTVTLKDSSGRVIHSVSYSAAFYSDKRKAEGGWSLEIIDMSNPCGGRSNWHESAELTGGTPCRNNSVKGRNKDTEKPSLFYAAQDGPNSVRLYFSENMDSASLSDPGFYYMDHGIKQPFKVWPQGPAFKSVRLDFKDVFEPMKRYKIILLDSLKDCAGNFIGRNETAEFALAEKPEMDDIVFNEILFDAPENGPEFIEVFNRSGKVVDISGFSISLLDDEGNTRKNISLKEHPFLLFPDCFLVFTGSMPDQVCFPGLKSPKNIITVKNMFALPDDGGKLTLNSGDSIIDVVEYESSSYKHLMMNTKGVSLERTDVWRSSADKSNWCPAAATSGYATPGYVNSQSLTTVAKAEVIVEPEIFSPDADGIDDLTCIMVECEGPASRITVCIFNSSGNRIKVLAENVPAGISNKLTWDGRDFSGRICSSGIYLVYAEVLKTDGRNSAYRKAVTLIRRY
jgi:hypothetical protein